MARARAAENPRSRPKAVLIEEITRGINKFQEVLAAIDDFGQEGFPYRDAARTKAELQFRECVRRAFGERSQEFQIYRNYKLPTSNKTEVLQSIAVVKGLIQTLEDKKLELQGLKPPSTADPQPETSPVSTAQMRLGSPTAQVTMAPQPVRTPPPMTVSVAMTTNLGMPAAPAASTPQSPPAIPEPPTYAPLPAAPMPQPPISLAPPTPLTKAKVAQAAPTLHEEPASATPIAPIADPPVPLIPARRDENTVPAQPMATTSSVAPPDPKVSPSPSAPTMDKSVIRPEIPSPVPLAPTPTASASDEPSTARTTPDTRSIQPYPGQEPLQLIRKVCLRFHSVARQLRLRKDYRTTLEVEDDYDLQDLLYALLKLEFDEVGSEEWTPPYTGGAPRTTLLVNRDQIAVVAKKTRSGLTTKELTDQVAADSAYYRAQDKCATLFCFIYDPEGRIGSPKRLETNLTSVSEHCTVEVLVAPK